MNSCETIFQNWHQIEDKDESLQKKPTKNWEEVLGLFLAVTSAKLEFHINQQIVGVLTP